MLSACTVADAQMVKVPARSRHPSHGSRFSKSAQLKHGRSRRPHQYFVRPEPAATVFDQNQAGRTNHCVLSSEVLHVLDQSAFIFVAKLMAVVMALVLDEVRTSVHFR